MKAKKRNLIREMAEAFDLVNERRARRANVFGAAPDDLAAKGAKPFAHRDPAAEATPVRNIGALRAGGPEPDPFGPHHPYGPRAIDGPAPHGFEPHRPHEPLPPHLAYDPHPHPHHPHGVHVVPRPHPNRVVFDEDALMDALLTMGAPYILEDLLNAPSEVKLALSLALDVPVCFMPVDAAVPRRGWGNPLLGPGALAHLEETFRVNAKRIETELVGAPLHMTALVLALAGYRPNDEDGDPFAWAVDCEGPSDGIDDPNESGTRGRAEAEANGPVADALGTPDREGAR